MEFGSDRKDDTRVINSSFCLRESTQDASEYFIAKKNKEDMVDDDDAFNRKKRKEAAQYVSSLVIFSIMFFSILVSTCSLLPHKERGPLSIGVSLLELLRFMLFFWAFGMMILVGAEFSNVHIAMFLFWAILMLLRSCDSISAPDLPILRTLL